MRELSLKRVAIVSVVSFALLGLTWLWPSVPAMEPGLAAQGPLMKAHFIDMGQANATVLEFQCGVVLIDAGPDQEHEQALVEFLNRFFDNRPAFDLVLWPVS